MTAIVAVVIFAAMGLGYWQEWAWMHAVDSWSLRVASSVGAGFSGWVTAWDVLCTLLGPMAFRIVGVVVIIWLLLRRHVRAALFLVFSVELSGLVTEFAKLLADRPRPGSAMVYAYSTSFPSGHALGVMAAVLAFSTLLMPAVSTRWRVPLIVAGTAIVILVGVGRVILNVHHPSDVVAGWALGYLWYLAWMVMLRPIPATTASAEIPAAPDNGR
ncbi:phosphatase PAP2 family protein [Mycolicibacterium mengxianglii]|uniref:phosphatase PAP2 family protein n=1 Tax=Mycolicibacterium mengxianglii TaxID=2736649 RepID=UPI001E4CA1D2|nr:phosphatase PAP2 family protein [Mycolicibacterium mengxianglii]